MNDSYVEILVKRKARPSDWAVKIGMLLLTVACFVVGLATGHYILYVPGIVLMAVDNFMLPLLSVEYEYLYVTGELTIDKIAGKSRRKNCITADMEQVECIAEDGSQKIKDLGNVKFIEKNYTSRKENKKIYACILHHDKEIWKILFEPNEEMLELMRQKYPRKIFITKLPS